MLSPTHRECSPEDYWTREASSPSSSLCPRKPPHPRHPPTCAAARSGATATMAPNGHAPYIMPDGKPLSHYLRLHDKDAAAGGRRKASKRGKDELWDQLVAHRARVLGSVHSGGGALGYGGGGGGGGGVVHVDHELAELRALEAAGARRRRRWMNEKTLRDLAGGWGGVMGGEWGRLGVVGEDGAGCVLGGQARGWLAG